MFRTGRARAWGLALAFACALHLGLFAWLVLGRRDEPRFAELPAIEVSLVEREPPEPPPQAAPPSAKAPRSAEPEAAPPPPSVLARPPSEAEAAALFSAPYGGAAGIGDRLAARRRCVEGAATRSEREDCERFFGSLKPTPVPATPGDEEKRDAFAMAARRKAAVTKYKDTLNPAFFPGLRCSFGRACEPADPKTYVAPGAPLSRR